MRWEEGIEKSLANIFLKFHIKDVKLTVVIKFEACDSKLSLKIGSMSFFEFENA